MYTVSRGIMVMSSFFNENLKHLTPYTPGEQPQDKRYVKLNTNESPFPPAPGVLKVVNEAEAKNLRLYSDPELKPLKAAIAETFSVEPANVFIGNGSDECLNFAFMAFGGDGMAYPDISYGFYPVFAAVNHIESDVKPLTTDFRIKVEDYFGIGKSLVLANPNAPTGLTISRTDVAALCEKNPSHVVIIDEAYVDFSEEPVSAVGLTTPSQHLLVAPPFSKSRSLAGARVGFAIGDAALIQDLETIKFSTNPYNVNRLSMAAAVEAIKDQAYTFSNVKKIQENRKYTTEALETLGFMVLPSQANFIFVRTNKIDGGSLYRRLKEEGVLVRHFERERIRDFVRVTIGSRDDMEMLVAKIKGIISA